jgi:hypothetical protein
MHGAEVVEQVRELHAQGLGARRIAKLTGLSPRTVTDWLSGRVPRSAHAATRCPRCGHPAHRLDSLDAPAYAYLLGMYLGDGYVATHARGVHRLRISLDPRYPGIIDGCEKAISGLLPGARVGRQHRSGPWGEWVEISAYSKS